MLTIRERTKMVESDSEDVPEEYENAEDESSIEIQDDLLVVRGTAI